MENKKQNVSKVFLLLTIIVIIVMGVLMYMQKKDADTKIVELENNESKLQETVNILQNEIDNVDNIDCVYGENDTKDFSNSEDEKAVKFNIEGKEYIYKLYQHSDDPEFYDEDEIWEIVFFSFKENGEVWYLDYQSVFKGTYKVVDDKIECDFSVCEAECGNNSITEFDKDITLTIVSESQIIGKTLKKKKVVDNNGNEDAELVWGVQNVVYELSE